MIVAKWLLLAVLALPVLEVAAFIAVAAAIGFLKALALLILASLAGISVLRHAGGHHITRVRSAMSEGLRGGLGAGGLTSLTADGTGGLVLLGGILLAIPGFITGAAGALVLLGSLWRALTGPPAPPPRSDGVVDLEPEQWHRVDDPALPGGRGDQRER